MIWNSLRFRLIAGGAVTLAAALTIANMGLTFLFERHIERTVAQDLVVYINQLLSGIETDVGGRLSVTSSPTDPRFSDPFSGLYWQIQDDHGQVLRSRSLWDINLVVPIDEPAVAELHQHEIPGPNGTRLLMAEQRVLLTLAGKPTAVRVIVASDRARIARARSAFAVDLVHALGLLGLVLAVATAIQVGLGLRPLDALRGGIAAIRAGKTDRLPKTVPDEVRPLVDEVNALLDAQEKEIVRSRDRAADLAHGLKTPLAALVSDAARLREHGEYALAQDIEAVSDAMHRHIDRELARARARGAALRGTGVSTPLAPIVRSLIAIVSRTPDAGRVTFEPLIPNDMTVSFDRTDLAEVLGNLLENAVRHAASHVRISAQRSGGEPRILIEDDGAGIAASAHSTILERGARLDERGEGAGLGLAIVQDVLDAYGWRLHLSTSELGGLSAAIAPQPQHPTPG